MRFRPGEDWLGGARPRHVSGLVAAVAPDGLPLLRPGVDAVLRRLFGSQPPRPADPDPGLCGPGSASWRVIAEPAAIAGGIRGLLVQTMHPLAMAGVADHSHFRADPLGRLQRTAGYVTTATFGTTQQVLEISQAVRRAHRRVRGIAPDGRAYSADDPALLTWVSCALTSSFLAADRLWAPRPITADDADRFVAEQSRLAALLDPALDLDGLANDPSAHSELRAGRVDLPLLARLPATRAQLVDMMRGFEPDLAGGAQAREAVGFLRWPPLPVPLRGAYLTLFAGAAGSLPRRARRMLGLPTGQVIAGAAVFHTANALALLRSASGRSPAFHAANARMRVAA